MLATSPSFIEHDIYRMEVRELGIIEVVPNVETDRLDVTTELVNDLIADFITLCAGEPHYLLLQYQDIYVHMSYKHATYIAEHAQLNEVKKAEAIVTSNYYSKLIVNFFLKLVPPPQPARMFTDATKAQDWLLQQ